MLRPGLRQESGSLNIWCPFAKVKVFHAAPHPSRVVPPRTSWSRACAQQQLRGRVLVGFILGPRAKITRARTTFLCPLPSRLCSPFSAVRALEEDRETGKGNCGLGAPRGLEVAGQSWRWEPFGPRARAAGNDDHHR